MAQRRIILLDSSGILNRDFHAMDPLPARYSSGHGIDVAAVAGYVKHTASHLYGQWSRLDFDCLIHVLDGGRSYARMAAFPEYKANRSPKNPALIAQEAMLPEVLMAMGEHIAMRNGVEADDVIATLTRQLVEKGDMVLVLSSDKDMLQLVDDGKVAVGKLTVDERDHKYKHYSFMDAACVEEKMGVRPEQVADFLALCGDAVDGIPGVAGVGAKTAAAWLREYGSLASLVSRADEVKGKMGERLRACPGERLALYSKLTRLIDDVAGVDIERVLERDMFESTAAAMWHTTLGLPEAITVRLGDLRGNIGSEDLAETAVANAQDETKATAGMATGGLRQRQKLI